jgi:hypothetical protein
MPVTSRGLRNQNPGNLRISKTKWQGQVPADKQTDASFVQFVSPQYGIRAIAKTLLTYQSEYKLNTVTGLIKRWAPPNENDTTAYISLVSRTLGVQPDDVIDVDDAATMTALVKAIMEKENRQPGLPWVQPYSDAVILQGLRMAGVHDAKPPGPAKRIMALCGAGCTAIATAATPDNLHQAQGFLQPLVDVSPILKGAFVALTLGALGLTMFGIAKSHRETGA